MVVVERVADAETRRTARSGASGSRRRRGSGASMARAAAARRAAAPRRVQQLDERLGAAVHRRDLGAVDSTSRLSMPRPAAAAIRCSMVRTRAPKPPTVVAECVSTTFSGAAGISVPSGGAEEDAGVGRGGGERHLDRLSGMKADALESDRPPDGLLAHPHARDRSKRGATAETASRNAMFTIRVDV